jgi:RimJ/RimL family protein N-acetyltransferase
MGYEIVDLKSTPLAEWQEGILAGHPYKPLWWVPGVTAESQRALLARDLHTALNDDRCRLLGLTDRGRFRGMAELRYMEWDSRHFAFPVHRLDNFAVWGDKHELAQLSETLVGAAIERARTAGARTIHSWLPMDAVRSVQALEDAGFRITDVLTTWVFEHAKQKISDYPDRCIIRGCQKDDEEVFVSLAREAYTETPDRFHSDPHLSPERSNEVYAEWIKNSFSGQLADHIIVAELDGRPAGYTTLKLEGNHDGLSNIRTAGLILSAMAPWAEGRGLYTSMINAGLKWFAAQGIEVSHLGTQVNNYPVQRAWARLGFRLAKSGPSMHLWLNE